MVSGFPFGVMRMFCHRQRWRLHDHNLIYCVCIKCRGIVNIVLC